MRVAVYARVSTTDQNCEMQVEELRRYCNTRDWDIYRIYQDTASGTLKRRNGRDELMADAAAHCFEAVLVWKIDRWGRSLQDVVECITQLDRLCIRFITATQPIDTDQSDPTSRFLLGILALVAEFERDMIRERQKLGIANMRANGTKTGKPTGRPATVFDRAAAYTDRMAGMTWLELERKHGASPTAIKRGIAKYAQLNSLPVPDWNEVVRKRLGKMPNSGKLPIPAVCEHCGYQWESKKKARACNRQNCQEELKRARRERKSEWMKNFNRQGSQSGALPEQRP